MIRKAEPKDLPIILSLIQHGREKMIASGNFHQWSNGSPTQAQIETDIAQGNSYLIENKGKTPIATFAFILGEDPTYQHIDGKGWINNKSYGTIHRIASLPNTHGILRKAVEYCFEKIDNLRIDTHEDNLLMRKAVEKMGFTYCGIIYLENGNPRMAYQKEKQQ